MIFKSIFNIRLYHGYFLNDGESNFSGMSDLNKNRILKNYKVSEFLEVRPTDATKKALKNHRILFKPHTSGFRLLVSVIEHTDTKSSPLIPFEDDLNFTFGIYANDPYFDNYSQVVNRIDRRLYLFSNRIPATEDAGFANIFTDDGTVDTSFLLKETSTRNLMAAIAFENEALTENTDTFSITNSFRDIEAKVNLTDAEKKPLKNEILNEALLAEKRNGLLGFIRLFVKGDANKNLLKFETVATQVEQYVLETTPLFTLSFKNRKTFWRYIKPSDNIILTTDATKPLTKNGFVKIEPSDFNPAPTEDHHYPNPRPDIIRKEGNKYYSEIFI
ncbi:hypothetical protein [Seonamhaeicola sp.]|uniref:hypothetical protein n=1 Tax=Seonamhaeicola sp. TaxID=1912245 RepID=UPI002631575E|nr:hypothetical protein [Seonamhaeicola sp.]